MERAALRIVVLGLHDGSAMAIDRVRSVWLQSLLCLPVLFGHLIGSRGAGAVTTPGPFSENPQSGPHPDYCTTLQGSNWGRVVQGQKE